MTGSLTDLLPGSLAAAEGRPQMNTPSESTDDGSLLVHFYVSLMIPWNSYTSVVVAHGDEVAITPEARELATDRNGASWLDLADHPEEQIRRWGVVRFASGPWPSDRPRLKPGSLEESEAIQTAWREAWAIPSEQERAEALTALRATYGAPPQGNRTVAHYGGKP